MFGLFSIISLDFLVNIWFINLTVCSDDIPKTKLKVTVTDSLRKALEKQKEQDKQEENEGKAKLKSHKNNIVNSISCGRVCIKSMTTSSRWMIVDD